MTTKMNGVSKLFELRQVKKRAENTDDQLGTLRPPRLSRAYGWEAFGQLVVQWRLERHLSAHELADDAGMSIEVIRTIESGAGMSSARYLLTLGELMELSIEKLLRLVGLVRTTNDNDLLQAALQFLVTSSQTSPNSTAGRVAAERFRQYLKAD